MRREWHEMEARLMKATVDDLKIIIMSVINRGGIWSSTDVVAHC